MTISGFLKPINIGEQVLRWVKGSDGNPLFLENYNQFIDYYREQHGVTHDKLEGLWNMQSISSVRRCTYKEFKKNKRCKFCHYFQKTEPMIDIKNGILVWNGHCHEYYYAEYYGISRQVKSTYICVCFRKPKENSDELR